MKRLILLCFAILLILTPLSPVSAETVVKELVENPDHTTLIFRITWDTGDLGVTLISPSGRRIPHENLDTDVKVEISDKLIEFKIFNPEIGLWQAEFNGGGNGNVQVQFSKIIEAFRLTDVQASQTPGTNEVRLSFSTTGDAQARSFNYEVYLVIDPNDMEGKLLRQGYGNLGEPIDLRFDFKDINSYGNYYLRVNATCEVDGYTDFDSVTTPAFSFENQNNLPEISGLKSFLNTTDHVIRVSWEDVPQDIRIEGYRVYLYADDSTEPIFTEDLARGETRLDILYPEEAKKLRVEVMSRNKGITGKAAIFSQDLSGVESAAVSFEIPAEKVVNTRSLRIPYKVTQPAQVTVLVNDQASTFKVEKDGILTLDLREDRNQVEFLVEPVSGAAATCESYDFIVDDTPPQLSIYEDINGLKVTDESIDIPGNVEQSAILTLNGQEVQFESNGDFVLTAPLRYGINTITIAARDYAGNVSEYKATVKRIIDLSQSYLILIVGIALSLIIVLVYFIRGLKKR